MTPAMSARPLAVPMLTPLLIFVIGRIRRLLRRGRNTMFIIASAFIEMQEMRRAAQQRFPHLDI